MDSNALIQPWQSLVRTYLRLFETVAVTPIVTGCDASKSEMQLQAVQSF
jgi:hypothetical protein